MGWHEARISCDTGHRALYSRLARAASFHLNEDLMSFRRVFILKAALVVASLVACRPAPLTMTDADVAIARHTHDLPDDFIGQQVHLMYVVPADGTDRELDTNGVIRTTVGAWQHWLSEHAGGRTLRVDTYHGELDISFY